MQNISNISNISNNSNSNKSENDDSIKQDKDVYFNYKLSIKKSSNNDNNNNINNISNSNNSKDDEEEANRLKYNLLLLGKVNNKSDHSNEDHIQENAEEIVNKHQNCHTSRNHSPPSLKNQILSKPINPSYFLFF